MTEFKESKFYKLLQDFFINNDKETFIQFLAEFYNKTEGIIIKNEMQDEIIKELREMFLLFNEEGVDENIVREKVNYFIENSVKIKDIISKIDTIMIKKANESEVRKKSVLIEEYDLGQSVKELLTNGKVAVVGERGVNKINVNNNAITLNQTDFIKQGNINLCLFTTFKSGYINATNGNLTTPSSEYKSTDFIAVSALNNYSSNETSNIAFYNSSKTFVSGKSGGTWTSPITIPEGVSYIRLTYSATNDNPIFNLGDKIYTKEEVVITDEGLEALFKKQIYNKMLTYGSTSLNLYNPTNDSADNTAINATNGKQMAINGYKATGFIEVIEGLNICISEQNNLAFYDENKIFVSGKKGGWSNPLTIPKGVKYLRNTFSLTAQNKQISYGNKLPQYSLYGEKFNILFKDDFLDSLKQQLKYESKLKNKTWNVLGDSITSINYSRPNWWEIIKDKYNMTVNNYGISGTTLAHTDDRHLWDYDFKKLDGTTIGYNPEDPSTWSTGNCMCERFSKMSDEVDLITVMGGTNDGSVKLGTWNSTDTSTFYGALNVLITGLINKYPNKKIAFFTPIQSANCYLTNVANASVELDKKSATDTLSLQLRVEAIKRKCKQYGIPCLDLFNTSGINGLRPNKYRNNDTLHPSIEGNADMSVIIENFILSLF